MTVVRPIESAEAPAFLHLLCEVFNLDVGRAESIFYSEPFFDLNRKWALFEGGQMRSILTTVPLEFGDGKAFGIAGVATLAAYQKRGLASRLLQAVLNHAKDSGEERALLFAHNTTVYERCGFQVLDHVIRAPIQPSETRDEFDLMPFGDVEVFYGAWASRDPMRLRRNATRWDFWKWNLRICSHVPGGYVCQEGDTVRECVFDAPLNRWPMTSAVEWYGLRSLAEELQLPLGPAKQELIYMGFGFDSLPKMFMTDQF